MAVEVGKIYEGKVASVVPFGAFISLPEGNTGLVHISEVASSYVQNVADHLKEGQDVKVKVISIDENGKVSLSIKKAIPEEKKTKKAFSKEQPKGPIRPADIDWQSLKTQSTDMSFEDKMNKFKSDSDERMQALKRSSDSKLSGGYKR
ncbi:MAG: S1 RNA-binding domain-containing protein [Ruminococcaceae bacterium]|nr:S1 RNA-binding domain-containing protein [Oscillospiraceae bacterium]